MIKHYNIHIFGRVQSVGFRHRGKAKADGLGLTGFIRNEADGSVYIEAEGDELALNKFIDWCRRGPLFAQVTKLEMKVGTAIGYSNFKVRFI